MTAPVQPSRITGGTLNYAAASASTATVTFTATNAGDNLIAIVGNTSQTTGYAAKLLSGCGATWYRAGTSAGSAGVIEIWYGINCSTSANITITTPGAVDNVGCQVDEWSGLSGFMPAWEYFQTVANSGTGATSVTNILTALNPGDLMYVGSLSSTTQTVNPSSPWSAEAGATNLGNQKAGVAYQLTASVAAQTATWTQTSGTFVTVGVVFFTNNHTGYAILNSPNAATNSSLTNSGAGPDFVDSVITALQETGTGVVSGCAVSPNTNSDMKFQVALGQIAINWGNPISFAAVTAQAVTASNASNPRRDLVYIDPTSTIHYVAGTAAAVPSLPTLPLNCAAVASIEVPANATQVVYPPTSGQAYIIDKRAMVGYPLSARDYNTLVNSTPVSVGETVPRQYCAGSRTATTGDEELYMVWLPGGISVGHLAFCSGGTGASTPTHWWFTLYDKNLILLATTADQTTGTWGSSTKKSLAIAGTKDNPSSGTTLMTPYSGNYYIGFMMTASTMPTLLGVNNAVILSASTPNFSLTNATAQTVIHTFPFTFVSTTETAQTPWGCVGL